MSISTLLWKQLDFIIKKKQLKGILGITKMFFTRDLHKKTLIALDMMFTQKWLAERAETDPLAGINGNTKGNEQGKTNYQVQKVGP